MSAKRSNRALVAACPNGGNAQEARRETEGNSSSVFILPRLRIRLRQMP